MKLNVFTRLSAIALLCLPLQSQALGFFSRACNWDSLSASMRLPGAILFSSIGTMSMEDWKGILALSDKKRLEEYWIHESITADYASPRYYLLAYSAVYRADKTDSFYERTDLYSSKWVSERLSAEVMNDSRLRILFYNRGLLFSARAGHPDIIKRYKKVDPTQRDYFLVVGRHWYFDPVGKREVYLGSSRATNCNLDQYGFEHR